MTIFIHSGYFYGASSSPLLLRGDPDYSIDTVSELTRRSATVQVANTSEGLAQGLYVAVTGRFGPAISGHKATNLPQIHHVPQILYLGPT